VLVLAAIIFSFIACFILLVIGAFTCIYGRLLSPLL